MSKSSYLSAYSMTSTIRKWKKWKMNFLYSKCFPLSLPPFLPCLFLSSFLYSSLPSFFSYCISIHWTSCYTRHYCMRMNNKQCLKYALPCGNTHRLVTEVKFPLTKELNNYILNCELLTRITLIIYNKNV